MYGFPRLEHNYPVKSKLEVEASALPRTENKNKRVTQREKNLISLLRATNFLVVILKLKIGLFKGSKSIKS